MRVTLSDSTLARQAGRFVWLGLNFDDPANRAFLLAHKVAFTPSLYVLDAKDDRVLASHLGGLTAAELVRFLDQGRAATGGARTPADSAFARAEEQLGAGQLAAASASYTAALALAPADWPGRPRTVAQLTWTLMTQRQGQACAETAAKEAPTLPREQPFVRTVYAGLMAANGGRAAPWAKDAARVLEPLAREALGLATASRDDRFQLHQQLMYAADARGDSVEVQHQGDLWIAEIDAVVPRSEDERTGLDVARADVASMLDQPAREIPALEASERAMPHNYNASLRLAQLLADAKRYDDAVAACERGLARGAGPLGRAWLGETKARALLAKGDVAGARRALDGAMQAAQEITLEQNRDSHLKLIADLQKQAGTPAP